MYIHIKPLAYFIGLFLKEIIDLVEDENIVTGMVYINSPEIVHLSGLKNPTDL